MLHQEVWLRHPGDYHLTEWIAKYILTPKVFI